MRVSFCTLFHKLFICVNIKQVSFEFFVTLMILNLLGISPKQIQIETDALKCWELFTKISEKENLLPKIKYEGKFNLQFNLKKKMNCIFVY